MNFSNWIWALFTVVSLVWGYLVAPPGTAAPGTTIDCSEWLEYSSSLTCSLIEQLFGMTEPEFEEWNPIVTELGSGCSLIPGLYYCVQVNFTTIAVSSSNPIPSTTTSTVVSSITTSPTITTGSTTTTSTTTSSRGIATPTPYETGMVDDCNAFHLVVSGDTCASIASSIGIAVSDFETWNPTVGSDCADLWRDYSVCTGIVSRITSSSAVSPTTFITISTSSGNGVTTPTPYKSGMVTDCGAFHLVVSGDDCADIAANANITVDEFYTWNPTVGTSCSDLWLDYYVCVGIS